MGVYHYLYSKKNKTVYELGQNVNGFEIVKSLENGLSLEEILTKLNDTYLPKRWSEEDIKQLSNNIANTIGTEGLSSSNDMINPPENCSQYVLVGTRYDPSHIGRYLWSGYEE